jgi:glutamate 5-kinase
MRYEFDLVGKIGSMALIQREDNDIDYNVFARVGRELAPGMIWVTSGAAEIGRLDYIKRTGEELTGDQNEVLTDYSAQGQSILMAQYRQFIPVAYSVRQVLVEHQHFNNLEKREHIKKLLFRARVQQAVPIINYNDPVSIEENRKWELSMLRGKGRDAVHECVDNDETAAVVAELVRARTLLILTSTDGIYLDVKDPGTLVREVTGKDTEAVLARIEELKTHCVGASRAGAGGALAKLEYVTGPVRQGTTVIIGHARHHIRDLLEGRAPATRIGVY